MPFESDAQARRAHTPEGTKALGGPDKVKEWDDATDFENLPKRKKRTPKKSKPPVIYRHTTTPRS